MRTLVSRSLLVLLLASILLLAGTAPAAEFLLAGDLPGGDSGSRLDALSAEGQVAGGSSIIITGNAGFAGSAPALFTPGGGLVALQDLPTVEQGGINTLDATGARAAGSTVIGLLPDGSNGPLPQAVLFDPLGNATILGDLWAGGDGASVATELSADGSVVVGFGSTVEPTLTWRLGAIESFVWSSTTGMVGIGTLPGYFQSSAVDVSADGSLVVGNSALGITGAAFLYDVALATRTDLGHLFPTAAFPSTGAIGIAADGTTILGTSSGDGETTDDLRKRADAALYAAKGNGGGFRFFTQSMEDGAIRRLSLENELRAALDREEIELHYQPRID